MRIRKRTISMWHMSNSVQENTHTQKCPRETQVTFLETLIVRRQLFCSAPDLRFPIRPSCDAGPVLSDIGTDQLLRKYRMFHTPTRKPVTISCG